MPNPILFLAAAGAAVLAARLATRQMRRVAREMERQRETRIADSEGKTLERDPETGVYRVRRDG